jgi:hypothetical protein
MTAYRPTHSYSGYHPSGAGEVAAAGPAWGMGPAGGAGPTAAAGETTAKGQKVACYPCDNCNEYRHWKYLPECKNYHLHFQQLAARAATMQGKAGGTPAATGKKSGKIGGRKM